MTKQGLEKLVEKAGLSLSYTNPPGGIAHYLDVVYRPKECQTCGWWTAIGDELGICNRAWTPADVDVEDWDNKTPIKTGQDFGCVDWEPKEK